jgi:hypothetical protein
VHSGIWEVIADTLYWLQIVWILSGFALMAYLAFRVFPWRDETQNAPSLTRVLPWQNPDNSTERARARTIVAGSYRFDWNYPQPNDKG